MATSLVVNGVSYLYPDTGDQSWGTVASAWAAAITSGTLQKAGGAFSLTADVNFGSSFGLFSKYFTSVSSNPASTGQVRLASSDSINFRNNANSADIALGKNSTDELTWNGNPIVNSSGIVPVGGGGTGLASGTSGGILGFTGSTTIASSGVLTANQLIIGGGAGVLPSSLAAGSQYQVLVMGASNPGYGQVNLGQSAAVTGTILAAQFPAMTGDVTTTAGSLATAIAATTNGTFTTLSALTTASSLTTIGTIGTGVWAGTTVATGHGGTGVTSVTTAPAASSFAGWDANKNLTANNLIEVATPTPTAAGTTTLVVGSAYAQVFTGSTTQTVLLPVTSTLVLNQQFLITNLSSGAVTVQSSGANTLQAMAANTQLLVTCIAITGTGTASWTWTYQAVQNSLSGGGTVTSVGLSVPTFLSISGSPITTSGTLAISLSGTALPAANGGTGQTSISAAFTSLFEAVATTLGDLVYGGASGAPTRLAGDTSNTRKFLREQSSGGTAAAPVWDTLQASDFKAPTVTTLATTGATAGFFFTVSSANATVGATYTNNGHTFTVLATIAAGVALYTSGTLAPTASGTLTKASGTGDATITYSAEAALALYTTPAGALYLHVRAVAGGGGGAGGGTTTTGGTGGTGGTTLFGETALIVCTGGLGGAKPGSPPTTGAGSFVLGIGTAFNGGSGQGSSQGSVANVLLSGGMGGGSIFGPGGGGALGSGAVSPGIVSSAPGGGGGGAGNPSAVNGSAGGSGGGGVDVILTSPNATYYYLVGAAGAAGSAGTSGGAGGAGGAGYIEIREHYQ